jgi:hypothetical protein
MFTAQPLTSRWVVNSTGNVLASIGVGTPLHGCFEKWTNML